MRYESKQNAHQRSLLFERWSEKSHLLYIQVITPGPRVRIPRGERALYARANAKSLSVKYGEVILAFKVSVRFMS